MTLALTKDLAAKMGKPARGAVYGPHSLCMTSGDIIEWNHPDEQYVIRFDRTSQTFTGRYYDWDDTVEEWVDTDPMSAEEIRTAIERDRLLFVG